MDPVAYCFVKMQNQQKASHKIQYKLDVRARKKHKEKKESEKNKNRTHKKKLHNSVDEASELQYDIKYTSESDEHEREAC